MKFKPGDVVVLKSDGRLYEIRHFENHPIIGLWYGLYNDKFYRENQLEDRKIWDYKNSFEEVIHE